jgi:hypothetical protein
MAQHEKAQLRRHHLTAQSRNAPSSTATETPPAATAASPTLLRAKPLRSRKLSGGSRSDLPTGAPATVLCQPRRASGQVRNPARALPRISYPRTRAVGVLERRRDRTEPLAIPPRPHGRLEAANVESPQQQYLEPFRTTAATSGRYRPLLRHQGPAATPDPLNGFRVDADTHIRRKSVAATRSPQL